MRIAFLSIALIVAAAAADPAKGADAPTTATARRVEVAAGAVAKLDLQYAESQDGRPLLLDLYRPAEGGPFPVVVWIHGGGWRAGTRRTGAQRATEWLLPEGIAVASVEYSLSNQLTFPAQIEECKAAVRWLRAHATEYDLNPERFGAWGSSSGAHLAMLLGVSAEVAALEGSLGNTGQSSRVQAVVDWWGHSDLNEIDRVRNSEPNSSVTALLGVAPKDDPEKGMLGSPMAYVPADDAPFLIFHGREDPSVPLAQSEIFHAALQKAGVESALSLYDGGHAGRGLDFGAARTQVVEFFVRHLEPATPPR